MKVVKTLLIKLFLLSITVSSAYGEEISTFDDPEAINNSLEQVTSVSQLSDVNPTDWAFQALQSLVERYGCIAGYPDKTYRGNRALSRYEFAAGLNVCLDKIQELIAANSATFIHMEDWKTISKLQEDFTTELASLRDRITALELRTLALEKQPFSTTTKLSGQAIFAFAVPISDRQRPLIQADLKTSVTNDDRAIFANVLQLTLNTSFTGKNLLSAQLLAYNAQSFNVYPEGFSFIPQDGTPNNSVIIDNLSYSFPIGDRIQVNLFASGAGSADIVTTTISPLNNSAQGSLSNFSFPPQYQYNNPTTGAGASLNFKLSKNWIWDFGFTSAPIPNIPSAGAGLFNGSYTLNTQLNYLSDWLDISFYYANSYVNRNFGSAVLLLAGYQPNLLTESTTQISNIYATQFNFKLGNNRQFNIGGGFVYAKVQGIGSRPDYDAWSYQATFAWNTPDGSQLGILAGVPPYTRDLANQSKNTGLIAEVYYRYQLNDNISITPSITRQVNPYNVESNPNAWIGAIRTTFSF
ncbi:iron uptake porin [Floridanema aerugineum]|uniref:Iron uptake porin n=1 Tax=Floridaenema aerugineum BLCC-F46 TaxID=3153654 RepID=A0ABV4X4L1_9CYAN